LGLQPRPEIIGLKKSEHGGPDYGELETLGIDPSEVVDFSVSSNPYGPPPGIRAVITGQRIDIYPDSSASELRHRLADRMGVSPGNILAGSGSTELIRLAALAYLGQDDAALIIEPTFGEYEVACRIMGANVIRLRLAEDSGFTLDLDRAINLLKQHSPQVVFLCNPNNPTGNYMGREEFGDLLAAAADSLVILDEAYVAFVDARWSWRDMIEDSNLLVLRSMTKDYALAGLRLGYAIAREEIIDTLRRICPPWNVNSIAQQAGIVALQQDEFLERSRTKMATAKRYLVAELTRLGFHCVPSDANFFLVEVGDASAFRRRLLEKGIQVRDCASFGLPRHIRIAPRGLKACRRLMTAIQEARGEDESGR